MVTREVTAARKLEERAPEYLFVRTRALLPMRYDAGIYRSRFFVELRDHKKIWANKCPSCGRLFCPPEAACYFCHGVEMPEWVEQADEGVLQLFQVVYFPFTNPMTGVAEPVPWAHGNILLDGGAPFHHRLVPADEKVLKVGDRYKAVWKEEGRTGHFWDILYFKKVEK